MGQFVDSLQNVHRAARHPNVDLLEALLEVFLESKSVLERALIDERRREIKANGRRSMEELKRRKLKFSSSISEMKKALAE